MADTLDTDTLASDLHGEPVGTGGRGPPILHCDYHITARTITPDTPVYYECCRLDTITAFDGCGAPDGWTLDAARCPDCAINSLQHPTDGYAEALIKIDIVDNGDTLTANANQLDVLDYSPHTDGHEPIPLKQELIIPRLEIGDWGIFRRSRLHTLAETLRDEDNHDLAYYVEDLLEISADDHPP